MNKNIKTKALEVISDPRVTTGILCGSAAILLGVGILRWKAVFPIAAAYQ